MRTLLLILFLLASRAACAQVARPWPRNAAIGKIEFVGRLPWPDSVRTEAQRQWLVRRWYRRTLTNDSPETIRSFIQSSGTTYGGIPRESCYRVRIMNNDREQFSLFFNLILTSDTGGLTYHFFDFEYGYVGYDFGGSDSLESTIVSKYAPKNILESFHEQLLNATTGL